MQKQIFLVIKVFILEAFLIAGTFNNFAQASGEPEDNPLAEYLVDQGYFRSGNAQLYYEVYGQGEPIILLHGLLGNTSSWGNQKYLKMSETLLTEYQLIAFDLRGHGKSEKFYGPESYGDKMAEDVFALMDHLQIGEANVFGYSFGVLLASQLLETGPERLNTVILGGGLWGRKGEEEDFSWAFDLADQLESGEGLGPLLTLLTADRETPYSEEELKEMETAYLKGIDVKAIAALLRSSPAFGINPSVMASNPVPVLAIMGESDPNVPYLGEWLKNSKNVQVSLLKGKNHLNAPEDKAFAEKIMEFLKKTTND